MNNDKQGPERLECDVLASPLVGGVFAWLSLRRGSQQPGGPGNHR